MLVYISGKKNPYFYIPANVPSDVNPVFTERTEAKIIDSGLNPDTFGTPDQWIDPTNTYETSQGTASWTLSGAFRNIEGQAVNRPISGWEAFKESYGDSTLFWLLGRDVGTTNLINLFEYPPKPSDVWDVNARINEADVNYVNAVNTAPTGMLDFLRGVGVAI